MNAFFRRFATATANAVGSPWTFVLGVLVIAVWAATGPIFGYSDTWQLIINTSTTIVTFLMVFLIQNTQNRDAKAIHLKLDELIRGVKGARTAMVALESSSDEELAELEEQFHRLHDRLARVKRPTEALETLEEETEAAEEEVEEVEQRRRAS
jgi:low affinity Fe/Cu permease